MKQIPLLTLTVAVLTLSCANRPEYHLFVGTFGEKIHEITFDGRTFSTLSTMDMEDPSYLAFGEEGEVLSPSHKYPAAYFCAFKDGECVGRCDTLGDGPAHIWHAAGTPLNIVSEYRGGSISVVRYAAGEPCRRVQFLRYEGQGPDPKRQRSPHVHQAKEIPAEICSNAGIRGRWIVAADLGLDCIHLLALNPGDAQPLTDAGTIPTGPASGPRHMEFNATTGNFYALTELSNELIAWKISCGDNGLPRFEPLCRFEVPGAGFQGGGDVHMSPDGRFIYTSHRCGNDGIATFSLNPDGSFRYLGYVNTAEHPRNFCITADGRYLLAACKNDRCIQVFKRNLRSGRLTDTGIRMDFATDEPVCLLEVD